MRLTIASIFLILTPGLLAQRQANGVQSVSIQILNSGAAPATDLSVQVRNLRSQIASRLQGESTGLYWFDGLEGETYEVTVFDAQGGFLQKQVVTVGSTSPSMVFHLGAIVRESPSHSALSAVSVRELQIPSRAAKEFSKSESAMRAGDIQASVKHLQKAIDLYPDYLEAHNNLGTQYIRLREYEKAIAELEKAKAIDPKVSKPYTNLGLALSLLGRYSEAEAAERQAMQLDPESVRARYQLGWILAAQGKDTPEQEELLRQAEEEIPDARLMLARSLLMRRAVEEAAGELKAYLNSSKATSKPLAQCWLAKISQGAEWASCRATPATP